MGKVFKHPNQVYKGKDHLRRIASFRADSKSSARSLTLSAKTSKTDTSDVWAAETFVQQLSAVTALHKNLSTSHLILLLMVASVSLLPTVECQGFNPGFNNHNNPNFGYRYDSRHGGSHEFRGNYRDDSGNNYHINHHSGSRRTTFRYEHSSGVYGEYRHGENNQQAEIGFKKDF